MVQNIPPKRKKKGKSDRMSEAEIKMQDANNFYNQLLKKINSRSHGKKCDGERIKIYLDYLVPKWEYMRPTRLYKHIQKMHENSENIRQFEIDLIWRRALYFIPLIVIFFSAFGIAFFNFYYESDDLNNFISVGNDVKISQNNIAENIENKFSFSKAFEIEEDKTIKNIILMVIAFINACLCFLLTKMNIESQQWQRNWELHIDYLQQILGFKLMQTCLRPRGGYFSIRTANTFIGFLAFLVWYSVMVILFALLLNIEIIFEHDHYKFLCDIFPLCVFDYTLVIVLIIASILALIIFLVIILAIFECMRCLVFTVVSNIISQTKWRFCVIFILFIPAIIVIIYPISYPILVMILSPIATFIFVNDIYYCLTGEPIFKGVKKSKKVKVSDDNKLYVRELEITKEEFSSIEKTKSENKKGIHATIIILSSVIIFSIPFIFIIVSYIMRKFFGIELTLNLIIGIATLLSCISNYFSYLIEKHSKKFAQA